MKQKIIFLPLIILSLLLVLSGCTINPRTKIQKSAEADKIVDWKTYNNEKYGYSFKYPSDCISSSEELLLKQKLSGQPRSERLCVLSDTSLEQANIQIFTDEIDNPTPISFHVVALYYSPAGKLSKYLKENHGDTYKNIPDKSNTQIAGIPAIRISSSKAGEIKFATDPCSSFNEEECLSAVYCNIRREMGSPSMDPHAPLVEKFCELRYSPEPIYYEAIWFIKNDKIFVIFMADIDNDYKKDLYEQILATFEFRDTKFEALKEISDTKPDGDSQVPKQEENDGVNWGKIYSPVDRFKIRNAKDDKEFSGTIQVDLSTFDCNLIHDHCPEVSVPVKGNLNFKGITKREILDLIKREDVFEIRLPLATDRMEYL